MLGELEPERETKNEMETHSVMESDGEIDEAREERSVAARAAAAEAKPKRRKRRARRLLTTTLPEIEAVIFPVRATRRFFKYARPLRCRTPRSPRRVPRTRMTIPCAR